MRHLGSCQNRYSLKYLGGRGGGMATSTSKVLTTEIYQGSPHPPSCPFGSKPELHFPASLRMLPAQHSSVLLCGSVFCVSSIASRLALRSSAGTWVLSSPRFLSRTRPLHLLKPRLPPTLRPSINLLPRPLQSKPPYLVTAGVVACSPGRG